MTSTVKTFALSTIENPSEDKKASPYLLFLLDKFDTGEQNDRVSKPEYETRNPLCVQWSANYLDLTITNLGQVASDLVQLDYQFRYCIDPAHKVNEGFVHPHAGEVANNTVQSGSFLDFVPAYTGHRPGSVTVRLSFPDNLPPNLVNLYFRAKVSTLWSKPSVPDKWNFEIDHTVVEATKRFAE